jgi:serine protease Do
VQTDGPSANADLHAGDVVTRIGSVAVADSDAFARTISSLPIDQPVKLSLLHDGSNKTIVVTPQVWPSPRLPVCRANQHLYWAGMVLSPAVGGGYAVKSIPAGSPYARQGVPEGTVVTGVGGKSIQSLEELQMLLARSGAEIARLDTREAVGVSAVAGAATR